jgi:hypothetical protein
MPAPHSERRIARDPRCGALAPDLVRGCNGHARGADCQCRILACLDATPASACNDRRQEQAFGGACVPGSLAAGQKASVRSTRIQGLSSHQARACDQEDQLFAIGRQRSLTARRLTGSSAPPAPHRRIVAAQGACHRTFRRRETRLRSFFSRWSIKFSAEYYEAKERQASGVLSNDTPTRGLNVRSSR